MGYTDWPRSVVARSYVPDSGDLVWLTFDPQAGHEQRGRGPALILSPRAYNSKARLAIAWRVEDEVVEAELRISADSLDHLVGIVGLKDLLSFLNLKIELEGDNGNGCPAPQQEREPMQPAR